jgi:hypothetical protein
VIDLGWWNLLFWPLAFYYLFIVTWMAYIAIMSLKDKLGQLDKFSRFNAYVMLFTIGYPLDLMFNIVASVVIFQRPPKAPLFTGTLKYWINTDGWRSKVATWICTHKLDPFDPGHCK